MATQTLLQENYLVLTGMVKHWDRRLRVRQTLLWLPRSLLPGVCVGLLLAVASRVRPWLMPQQIALITGALLALGAVLFALAVWLWRRPALTSARRFDVQFRLNERVSTALELGAGAIHANDELTLRQLEDARAKASTVRVSEHIPLALSRKDWIIVVVLAAALALLLILPNPQTDALLQASAQQAAIDNAAEQMRETTQDVAADTSLSDEQRRTLLEQLKTAVNTLEQPNVTPEEAFAAVSQVQSDMQDDAGDLNRQSSLNQSALQAAADALRQAANQGDQNGTMEQVTQNLSQMAQNASSMTPEQRQQAAQALQNAAQALQNSNPQAAQNLNNASQQLQQQNLNQQQLQQALQQASQQMQQQMQQTQQQQQAAQNLQQQAQQAQQSAQQISQAQQQQGQQSQQGQQQSQQSQQGQQGQQGQQQSQQTQNGSQSQQSQQSQNGGQPQQGESDSAQALQSGDQSADQAQSEQGVPGQGQQGDTSQQAQGIAAGDEPGSQAGDDSQGNQPQGQQSQAQTDNNPDGQGEAQFEAVNVPRRIGPQANDGNNVELAPDDSNAPVQEGNFSENPNGQVTVPYNQVFSDYANAANHALDSGYVPLGLRDVVRDYFTSLEPKK